MRQSIAQTIAQLPEADREAMFREIAAQSPDDQVRLLHSWDFWARPSQREPLDCSDPACGCNGEYTIQVFLGGRGIGKTRTAAERAHSWADRFPGCRIGLVSPTAGDARDVLIEGESGIVATQKPWNPVHYEPSKRRVTWTGNGSQASVFSADEPDRLRGPQFHFYILDELAAYQGGFEGEDDDSARGPKAILAQVRMSLRLPCTRPDWPPGFRNRVLITTTPRPLRVLRKLVGVAPYRKAPTVHVTTGSTYENRANLSPEFFEEIIRDLEGTRLGRQELMGEILQDVPGALWKASMIKHIEPEQIPEDVFAVCVAIDPAATSQTRSNLTGIVVCASGPPPGEAAEQEDENEKLQTSLRKTSRRHGYVLADVSVKGSPDQWARAAVRAYHEFGASCIVAEANQGGDLILHTIRTIDASVPIKMVHATKNKQTRAEPIVALYEQQRVWHCGKLSELENEMETWDPNMSHSPDRVDALVWGMHWLLGRQRHRDIPIPVGVGQRSNPFSIFSKP